MKKIKAFLSRKIEIVHCTIGLASSIKAASIIEGFSLTDRQCFKLARHVLADIENERL